jgi:hypothetical protein
MAGTVEERLNYGSNIPAAREIVSEVLSELNSLASYGHASPDDIAAQAGRLREALGMMTRRQPVKVAPRRGQPVTEAVKARIKQLAAANPDWSMQQIAVEAGTNSGRVSEVLNGLR